jgi:hypothetical protein
VAILDVTVHPEIYLLAEREGAEGNLRASFGERVYFLLKPSTEKEIRIVPKFKNGVALELSARRVLFCIWWRRGNATWLPQIPVPIFTSAATIRMYGLEKPDVLI